ncbi:unnamed protein product [Adineta ricciae]|uniref:Myb/SANT-like DNA-binding domain-containing protein n=1 Tax=Adineta ricciae TaxID=249248 RepID=A0A816C987_ADIRI|nr:unnamed protein product [Adineta ricciae]
MRPQYVRIIVPSNQQIRFLAPVQQGVLQQPRLYMPSQVRMIAPNASVVTSSVSSSNFENNTVLRTPLASLDANCSTSSTVVAASSNHEPPHASSTSTNTSLQNTFVQFDSTSDKNNNSNETVLSTSIKRNRSSSSQSNKTLITKSATKMSKKNKRGKNWSEEETSVFINIWSEHYDSLMTGGTRNTKIYHGMAQQLNEFLSPRVMTGTDVKAKIANLVSEYRKKRKESGKTGSSPSSWPYFEQIDKLLGARPFNDESLLSDSISLQDEQVLVDIENTSPSDLNLNSLVKDDEDNNISTFIKEIEEITNNTDNRSCNSKSPPNSASTQKTTTSNTPDNSIKRNLPSKKKKVVDMRMELVQQMINKIDGANDMAIKAESKALLLLEKQTKLQEESLNNEKEFLNVFRSIANSFNTQG